MLVSFAAALQQAAADTAATLLTTPAAVLSPPLPKLQVLQLSLQLANPSQGSAGAYGYGSTGAGSYVSGPSLGGAYTLGQVRGFTAQVVFMTSCVLPEAGTQPACSQGLHHPYCV